MVDVAGVVRLCPRLPRGCASAIRLRPRGFVRSHFELSALGRVAADGGLGCSSWVGDREGFLAWCRVFSCGSRCPTVVAARPPGTLSLRSGRRARREFAVCARVRSSGVGTYPASGRPKRGDELQVALPCRAHLVRGRPAPFRRQRLRAPRTVGRWCPQRHSPPSGGCGARRTPTGRRTSRATRWPSRTSRISGETPAADPADTSTRSRTVWPGSSASGVATPVVAAGDPLHVAGREVGVAGEDEQQVAQPVQVGRRHRVGRSGSPECAPTSSAPRGGSPCVRRAGTPRRRVPPRQDERVELRQLLVVGVARLLQPVDVGVVDAQRRVLRVGDDRRAQVGADVEQVVLDRCSTTDVRSRPPIAIATPIVGVGSSTSPYAVTRGSVFAGAAHVTERSRPVVAGLRVYAREVDGDGAHA